MRSCVRGHEDAEEEAQQRRSKTRVVVKLRTETLHFSLCVAIILISANEYLAYNIIVPFSRDIVLDVGVSPDYAGIAAATMTGCYGIGVALSARTWGAVSDRYGRRPVLLAGAFASAVSTSSLGVSTSLWACLVSRLVGGLCNGLWCVLKSAVSDIVTDTKGQSRCFALMQIAASLGAIVGPTIGGVLVGLGGKNKRFALPCFLCAVLQLTLAGTGVALWPHGDDSAMEHDVALTVAPSARAVLEEAVDGDSIRCLPELLETPLEEEEQEPTPPKIGESKSNKTSDQSLMVYEVTGSTARRFKVLKASPGPQVSFVLAGGLCALAATAEEIAHVGEALALTASRPEGGAGETEATTGLCFAAGGVIMLCFLSTGLPSLERLVRGSQRSVYQGAVITLAAASLALPALCLLPGADTTTSMNNLNMKPRSWVQFGLLVVCLGVLNSAAAAAIVSATVLVQKAIVEDSRSTGAGNGTVQAWIATGRVLGPVLAGVTFDLARRTLRFGSLGPFATLALLCLVAIDLSVRFSSDDREAGPETRLLGRRPRRSPSSHLV